MKIAVLQKEEREDVEKAEDRTCLFVAGIINFKFRTITLFRADCSTLAIPLAVFTPSGNGTKPNFRKFRIVDCGQTIQFGKYEASSGFINEQWKNWHELVTFFH